MRENSHEARSGLALLKRVRTGTMTKANKVLITGASSGIGEACARAFGSQNRDLVLVARRRARLEGLAAEIKGASGVSVETFELDVSSRASVDRFVAAQAGLLSEVSVLVNNAGLARGLDTIQDGNLDDWEAMIDTNVKGLLYMTRAVLPHMVQRKDGHIVNIGSVAGFYVYPKGNIYCATKFAVRALNEALRLDLNGTGVRVTEISPGMVETEFSEVRLASAERAKAVYSGMTPLTAEDVAETVVWCASRPRHVNVQEVILYPTDQASPTVVHRR